MNDANVSGRGSHCFVIFATQILMCVFTNPSHLMIKKFLNMKLSGIEFVRMGVMINRPPCTMHWDRIVQGGRSGSEFDGVVGLGDGRLDAVLDEDAVPDHEDQQGPDPSGVVQGADAVFLQQGEDGALVE